jgi:hypothetical protein
LSVQHNDCQQLSAAPDPCNILEEAGIQMLGSDDKAIKIVRLVSILSSTRIIFVAVIILSSFPPAIQILMGHQNFSYPEMLKQDGGSNLYFALPITGAVITSFTNLVRI